MEEKEMVVGTVSRRYRKKNNTHRSLLHAAKQLFEKKGLGNVTIDEIAEEADVSRSTFFTHFTSLDDIIEQITAEEINDLKAVCESVDTELSVTALMNKLIEDTVPYPYLTSNLIMRSILGRGDANFAKVYETAEDLVRTNPGYQRALEVFSAEEISSYILGAYFGIVFQRFIKGLPCDDGDAMKESMDKLINFLKK